MPYWLEVGYIDNCSQKGVWESGCLVGNFALMNLIKWEGGVKENGRGGVNIKHHTNSFFYRKHFLLFDCFVSSTQIFIIDIALCYLIPIFLTVQSSLTISQLFSPR